MIAVISAIISFILGIAVISAFTKKLATALKEVNEVLAAFAAAIADGRISAEEITKIIDEAKDVPGAIIALFKKE